MVRTTVPLAVAVLTLAWGSGRADTPPAGANDSATMLARVATKRIEGDEAVWENLTADLKKALDTYAPGPLSLPQEQKVLAALRGHAKKQFEDGKVIVEIMEKWTKASSALSESLKNAPAFYAEAARLNRSWAEAAKYQSVKEDYVLVAEMWQNLARQAEKRVKELHLDNAADGTLDLLKEQNLFLDRFVETLNAVPQADDAAGQYQELRSKIRNYAERYHEMPKSLKSFRDKVGGEAFNPEVRERTRVAIKADVEEEARRQARVAREERRKEVLAFVAKSALYLTNIRDGWAAMTAPPGTGIKVRDTFAFYRVGDGIEPTGKLEVTSGHDGVFVVHCLSGFFQDGDFACAPGTSPPKTLLAGSGAVASPPAAPYPGGYASFRGTGRD